jgi:CBS domain-containing protein
MRQISEIIAGKPLVWVESGQNVWEVARVMTERNVGAVAVLEGGKLVGLFSERDLMTRVVARDLLPRETPVSTVMTRQVAVASPTDQLSDCLQKMHALNCRHLPVTDEGRLIGMISLRDLLQIDNQQAKAKVSLLNELVTYSPDYES